MPDPKKEQGHQTPKAKQSMWQNLYDMYDMYNTSTEKPRMFGDGWYERNQSSKPTKILGMWIDEIKETRGWDPPKNSSESIKAFREKFAEKKVEDIRALRSAARYYDTEMVTQEQFEDLCNLAGSHIERNGKMRTMPLSQFGAYYEISPDTVFGCDLEAQRIHKGWREERLLNDPQFAHYLLAKTDMPVADVLNVEIRKKAIQDLPEDDPYWDVAYPNIWKRSDISYHAAKKLVDYFEERCYSLQAENSGRLPTDLFTTSEFEELCRFMPTLGIQDVQKQCKQTTIEPNTWPGEEYKVTQDFRMAQKNAMRIAKRCEKIHDFLEVCQTIHPQLDQLEGGFKHPLSKVSASFGNIAYASVWMHQFETSKEKHYIDRMPSRADMGDTKLDFWLQFAALGEPYDSLYNMRHQESKLIRWPSEADIDSGRFLHDLQNLANESRATAVEKGVLKNVDFKEFKELTKKLVEACIIEDEKTNAERHIKEAISRHIPDRERYVRARAADIVDSEKADRLKECIVDGTLTSSIQFRSEGGRLRMTVADSLYEEFELTSPRKKTEPQMTEPKKDPPQKTPPQKSAPKARTMGK